MRYLLLLGVILSGCAPELPSNPYTNELLVRTKRYDNICRIIRHTGTYYTLLQSNDIHINTIEINTRVPPFNEYVWGKYATFIQGKNQVTLIADVDDNQECYAITYEYYLHNKTYFLAEIHIHDPKEIQGGEYQYQRRINKHWRTFTQESKVIE